VLVREFGEVIRSENPLDEDVFAEVRALVEGLDPELDPETLIPQVMVLVEQKIKFLVTN
jgi:hypothetical protein